MTDYNFYIFTGLVLLMAGLSTFTGHEVRRARNMNELTDRPGWILGAAGALIIAFWRPWFTDTWWKAIIFAPVLLICLAAFSRSALGVFLQPRDGEHTVSTVSRFLSLAMLSAVVFFVLRSCG